MKASYCCAHPLSSSSQVSLLGSISSRSSHNDTKLPAAGSNDDNDFMMMKPPPSTNRDFVNLYMIVDPSQSSSVTIPRQVVTYDRTITAIVGPTQMAYSTLDMIVQQQQTARTTSSSSSSSSDGALNAVVSPPNMTDIPKSAAPAAVMAQEVASMLGSSSASSSTCSNMSNNNHASSLPLLLPALSSLNRAPTAATTTSSSTSLLANPPPASAFARHQDPLSPPLRALSAYNWFFRDERERILANSNNAEQATDEQQQHDYSTAKKLQLLHTHWNRDRSVKRRHRKTHGKIPFTTLSKLVSSRWKQLAASKKDFYRSVAAMDLERYQRESTLHAISTATASTLTASSAAAAAAASNPQLQLQPLQQHPPQQQPQQQQQQSQNGSNKKAVYRAVVG